MPLQRSRVDIRLLQAVAATILSVVAASPAPSSSAPIAAVAAAAAAMVTSIGSSGAAASASRGRVAEFARQPFIRRALREVFDFLPNGPSNPRPVVAFYYGVDCDRPEEVDRQLRQGGCLESMPALWYGGGPSYDRLCRIAFSHLVRRAGGSGGPGGEGLLNDPAWHATADGLAAQLVLCDQLSRNCFRGTPEAFAYDEAARDVAIRLSEAALLMPPDGAANRAPATNGTKDNASASTTATTVVEGQVYPPYLASAIVALMHSEDLKDHEAAARLLDRAEEAAPSARLRPWWDVQRRLAVEHRAVLEEFGRYPHRNAAFHRTSTPFEVRWLASDQVPGWARSQ